MGLCSEAGRGLRRIAVDDRAAPICLIMQQPEGWAQRANGNGANKSLPMALFPKTGTMPGPEAEGNTCDHAVSL
jgi:hypothetical protein